MYEYIYIQFTYTLYTNTSNLWRVLVHVTCIVRWCAVYFLRLEDTLGRLRWPSVVDLKMGRVSYDRSASAAKRREENAKYEFRDQVCFYCQTCSQART